MGTQPGQPVSDTGGIRSLYLHVPFCERKCEYCDFTSVAGLNGATEYMRALCEEVRVLGRTFPGVRLDTVFVGGGTPSLVEPGQLAALLATVGDAFDIAVDAEITLEANPSSTSRQRAETWRTAGFNRVSIGVQSLEPDILAFLGRVHDRSRALDAVREVQEAGFDSVNCDLIYAVPGLDDERWGATVRQVTALGPAHVSCYELTVEPGTPLHRSVGRGTVTPVDAAAALRQQRIAARWLERAGLARYEVSNYARDGMRSRHNLAYWRNAHYLAAGVGAHGHVPAAAAPGLGLDAGAGAAAVRYWHGKGIGAYVRSVAEGRLPIAGWEAVDPATQEVERVMLGLRLAEGVELRPGAVAEAHSLAAAQLLRLEGRRATATARGRDVLNAVAARLVAA
ncbi:MAG: radical SAM family heme chaperone HemW [Candidatus Dormibacteraeota bacterium]|nr:radical SAM family heme chaperone HemW [Candidatus Dormibacteraeota bacterium]